MESFNGKLRDELLNREIFYTLTGGADSWCGAGAASTTRCGPIAPWAISRPHPKRRCCSRLCSAPPAPTTSCQHRFNELRSGPNTLGQVSYMQEFNPEVKRAKRNGQTVWEVDCRTWAGLMNQIQRPLRRRFRTRREAQRWCYQLVVDVRIGREPDPGPMALLDLCDLYLQSIKNSDKSKETYKTYKSLLRGRRFTGFLERRAIVDVCDLNPAELEHYRQQCHAELSAAGGTSGADRNKDHVPMVRTLRLNDRQSG